MAQSDARKEYLADGNHRLEATVSARNRGARNLFGIALESSKFDFFLDFPKREAKRKNDPIEYVSIFRI
jgi:uncharacterized protein (DUF1015 family)